MPVFQRLNVGTNITNKPLKALRANLHSFVFASDSELSTYLTISDFTEIQFGITRAGFKVYIVLLPKLQMMYTSKTSFKKLQMTS